MIAIMDPSLWDCVQATMRLLNQANFDYFEEWGEKRANEQEFITSMQSFIDSFDLDGLANQKNWKFLQKNDRHTDGLCKISSKNDR
jgi:hypothetical protein